ncbi:MAG: response regulator [Halobacteriovoraceae bacterium]|jgi:CheY-like chemotaxis protein|nr:response regulator [Halobacteriovoraceae bacterium]
MKHILVVDDEIDILETIIESLEIALDAEILIHRALNGVEALALFNKDQTYDLIVTDLNMPKMDGVSLTENIRRIQADIPIIVFTGHGDLKEQVKLNSFGIFAMIKKPYVEDLILEVSKAINL